MLSVATQTVSTREAYEGALCLGFFKAPVRLAGGLHPFLYLCLTLPADQADFLHSSTKCFPCDMLVCMALTAVTSSRRFQGMCIHGIAQR